MGTIRLRARPAKKAPTIGSMPTTDAVVAPTSRTPIEKVKRTTRLRPIVRKYQRPSHDSTTKHITARTTRPIATCASRAGPLASPAASPETTASTTRARVSVITVAPTVMATARLVASP